MKKTLFALFMMTIMISVSSGICFAGDGDGSQAYAEEQARIAQTFKPVVFDRDYPQWGFWAHSWITGTGSKTVAHTQIIDRANGKVITEVNRRCNYADPVYDYSGSN